MPGFISFEGIDGCGKTSQIQALVPYLESRGRAVLSLREPGGTPLGEKIRSLLLKKQEMGLCEEAELLLFMASRSQLCRESIRPALAEGKLVLCDRFMDSSLAYQGVGRGLGVDRVVALNSLATGATVPDLTFLLDLDPQVAQTRIQQGRGEKDRMEEAGLAFAHRVRQAFLDLAASEPDRILVLDANVPFTDLQEQIRYQLEEHHLLD